MWRDDAGATELRIGALSSSLSARQRYVGEGFVPYIDILAKPLARSDCNEHPPSENRAIGASE